MDARGDVVGGWKGSATVVFWFPLTRNHWYSLEKKKTLLPFFLKFPVELNK
jgi:hypothetical protein